MSTKSVISVILLCVILMACSKSDEHFKPKSEELSSALITFDSTRTECVKIFYRTNSSLDYPINIIGDYHNQFLEGLQDSIVVTDKCSESQLNAIDVLIENYLNSNEFRIQTRKIFNGIKKDGEQIDKDERSIENQIKNRRKNLEDSKKNINSIITSLVSNAGLSDDILDGDEDDLLLE